MWFRQPRTGRKLQPPRSNGLPAPRPMPPPTAAIRQVALGQGEFIERHELDRKWRVPESGGETPIVSGGSEARAVCPHLSTANCSRSRCEKVFEDILAIHSGERLFTNFTVHQPAGGLGLCLYTHHLVVRATFRALEISGDVSGGHLHPVCTSLETWATQASSGFHRWTCPHAGHRRGRATGGKVSKMTISVVRPVRTGLRLCGHLIRMWFTADPSGRFSVLLRSLPFAVAHKAVALYEMQMLLSRLTPTIFISR